VTAPGDEGWYHSGDGGRWIRMPPDDRPLAFLRLMVFKAHRVRIPTPKSCWEGDVPHIHLPDGNVLIDYQGFAAKYRRRFHVP